MDLDDYVLASLMLIESPVETKALSMSATLYTFMPTTIQLSDDTKRLLNQIKARTGQSFDKILKDLIYHKKRIPKSLFGKHKNLPSWGETKKSRRR